MGDSLGSTPARHGAVAAGHVRTAEAAADMLREGGNAFDAAVAGLWMACVAEPVLASPGGGGFAAIRHEGTTRLLDFFVDTPGKCRSDGPVEFETIAADFGTARQTFHIGSATTAVPGFIHGVRALHRYATMPMIDLARPAVEAARSGLTVTPFQAFLFQVVAPILTWSADVRALFAPEGRLLTAGARFVNEALAEALEATASDASACVPALAAQQAATGGHLTEDDVRAYRVVERAPLQLELVPWRLFLNPSPSIGGPMLADLLRALAASPTCGPEDRIAALRKVGAGTGLVDAVDPPRPVARRGTTHIGVIDQKGAAVSVTVSNGEGNGRLVPDCGFMANNMLGETDVNPYGARGWPARTRLSSMMAPTLADGPGGAAIAAGSGGSSRIATALFQVLADLCLCARPVADAVAAPRLHLDANLLDVECDEAIAMAAARKAGLDIRGWPERSLYFGGAHTVMRRADGSFEGAGDQRRDGAFLAV